MSIGFRVFLHDDNAPVARWAQKADCITVTVKNPAPVTDDTIDIYLYERSAMELWVALTRRQVSKFSTSVLQQIVEDIAAGKPILESERV